ncbi:ABC transporter substrate-binding protein [Scytonema sp. UIC 10036]|uniref:ABC transporter substrate-binding protein n=1 Tax=Scytonema sp. UIC 10036 TaxID=2304196 RepID=UPI0012DAEB11|nr:ABC transporter substrate-binding protein [Scytonema sp. UIC 10036]MUG96205.1 ABC transporter substrate-binding protein [Scytonema sp. UIC 10036]
MKFKNLTKIFQRGWILLTLLSLLVVLALNGCNPSQFKTKAAQVTQIVARTGSDPKTYNYALIAEFPNLIPFINEGLITEDKSGKIEPALAEKWEMSEDKLRIVFTLKEGLKWSDGHPLTVDDVVFSYNDVYFNPKIPAYPQESLKIGEKGLFPKVQKLDARRVEFTTPEPFAPFFRSTGAAILPKHKLAESVKTNDSSGKPKFLTTWGMDTNPKEIVSNGPYVIESYSPSERLVFRRNPYYWRKDAEENQLPYIERVVWQIVESTDTAIIQFRSGGLDTIAVGPSTFALLKREEKRGDFRIYNGGSDSSSLFVTFNQNKGKRNGKPLVDPIKSRWFNTAAFRQAVAYAIDRKTMNSNTLRGVGDILNSPIFAQSPYYLSPKEGLKVYDYNPEKSKELLLGAGFKYKNNQLFDAEGNRIRFTMISQTGSRLVEALGSQIKTDLAKIGIQVDYQQLDFGTVGEKLSNSLDWECWLGGSTGGIEPHNGFNMWSPDGSFHPFNQKPLPGQTPITDREVTDWEEKIGRLYVQGARELDEAKRKAIYGETQQIAQEYVPYIYLVNPLVMAAVRNRIQNVEVSSLSYETVLWNAPYLKAVD